VMMMFVWLLALGGVRSSFVLIMTHVTGSDVSESAVFAYVSMLCVVYVLCVVTIVCILECEAKQIRNNSTL
jgi:hypothetical protein